MTPLLLAQASPRTTFEWGAIQTNTDWIVPIGVAAAIIAFVLYMYFRDVQELNRLWGAFLAAIRSTVFLGLLILYLQPQWRTEKDVLHNSRVLLLVDTSLSMGLTDVDMPAASATTSRIGQVATALSESSLIEDLRREHDVIVWQFNDELNRDRVVTLAKSSAAADEPDDGTSADSAGETVSTDETPPADDPVAPAEEEIDWHNLLLPAGTSTQLGEALQQLIYDEQGSPVSAVVLFSDGGKNKGVDPKRATDAARKANLPIHVFGLGSDQRPANVRVADLVAPARAYPGDSYKVTGYVQAQQMAGRVVEVQLLSRESDTGTSAPGSGQLEDTQQVTLRGDGKAMAVKFELTPEKAGHRTLCFRVQAPTTDRDPADNLREVDVEIVDRENRVLLMAGGPTRDYRFLRALLHRDRSVQLHVLLQTAQPDISQEADRLLDDFPATRDEMFEYDCLVAFDPDWRELAVSQTELLETWVAEQGGGMIVVAGPVHAGEAIRGWVEDPDMAKIRALYPVEFFRRFSVLDVSGMEIRKEPWHLEFTREGLEADYLWLDDTATLGRQAWEGFPGVYGYCPVRGPKPGATVLARFSDPRTAQGERLPVYFAEQFYGSGLVFYIGSGEMWRLRAVEGRYFEQFYTKLIRHVSQGRLLRESSRGVLLVGQDRYLLGGTVRVQAQLTNARLEPLDQPHVRLQVIRPDASVHTVTLGADPARKGAYLGQFPVLAEGSYRLQLPIPESDERLSRRIQVNVPDLEREDPRRNDALLGRIAERTGGRYRVGLDHLFQPSEGQSFVEQLKNRTKITVVPVAPDPLWKEGWLRWMMIGLCSFLCIEWLVRRLIKLA